MRSSRASMPSRPLVLKPSHTACYRPDVKACCDNMVKKDRLLLGRRVGLPGKLLARRIDVGPRPGALRPDVGGDLHAGRIVERADAQAAVLRRKLAPAEEGRAAVAAEEAVQRAPAVGSDRIALGRALRNLQGGARNHRVNAARGAGGFLAVAAMAGAQLADRHADGVADRAAEAAAGERFHFASTSEYSGVLSNTDFANGHSGIS